MISYNNQRIAILIDTANLYHTAKYVYRSKVHFESLINTIANSRSITRAIAYAITSDNANETSFLETLTAAGIEVRTKPLITYRQGNQKADWDVGIAIDAVALAPHIDTLVIVSGDGDFAPLVRHMQSQGVRVEAAAFDQSVSQLLTDIVDWYHDLSAHTDTILINYKNPLRKREHLEKPVDESMEHSSTPTKHQKPHTSAPLQSSPVNRQVRDSKTASQIQPNDTNTTTKSTRKSRYYPKKK